MFYSFRVRDLQDAKQSRDSGTEANAKSEKARPEQSEGNPPKLYTFGKRLRIYAK